MFETSGLVICIVTRPLYPFIIAVIAGIVTGVVTYMMVGKTSRFVAFAIALPVLIVVATITWFAGGGYVVDR